MKFATQDGIYATQDMPRSANIFYVLQLKNLNSEGYGWGREGEGVRLLQSARACATEPMATG